MYAAQPYGQQYLAPQNPFAYAFPPPFYPSLPQYNLHGFPPYGSLLPQISTPISPIQSPRAAMRLRVPLAEFCSHYAISDSDQTKLELMEYKPGNRAVETMNENEWKMEFKFTKLGWNEFLDAHKAFLKDVKSGDWAAK